MVTNTFVFECRACLEEVFAHTFFSEPRAGHAEVVTHTFHEPRSGHAEVVTTLLDAGAYVDSCDGQEFTALHNACRRGNVKVVEVLLTRNARVNLSNDFAQVVLSRGGRCLRRRPPCSR